MRSIAVLSSVAMTWAVVATHARAACEAHVIERPGLVAFDGCIDQQSAQALMTALERNPKSPVLVKSGGGAVNAAVEVATMMARLGTRLIIRGQCLSSCANYWLPAAASVDVEEASVIGFHGDARTTIQREPPPGSFGPEALRGIHLVLAQESEPGKTVPKVEDVHVLQSIRVSTGPLLVRLRGRWQRCTGLALAPVWAPTLARLQVMGLVHRIIPQDPSLEPMVRIGHDAHPMNAANDDSDPAARCVDADAPRNPKHREGSSVVPIQDGDN